MTRASLAAAVIPLILAACAPRSAPDVQTPPPKEGEAAVVSPSKPSAQAGLWLEVEGRVKKVATVSPGGEVVMSVPELRHSAPSVRRLGARLEARELVIEGEPDISLKIDEEGFIRTTPDGLFGKDTLRVVGSELVSGDQRFRLDDGGAVSPPILEAANLWLRGADGLSAEQKWLVVVAELTFVRGGEMMFFVLGKPAHG